MAQRISRAKRTIKWSGSSSVSPTPTSLPARIALVLRVIYLVFNEVDHPQHERDTGAGQSSASGRRRNGTPDDLIVHFAREMRWAIVGRCSSVTPANPATRPRMPFTAT